MTSIKEICLLFIEWMNSTQLNSHQLEHLTFEQSAYYGTTGKTFPDDWFKTSSRIERHRCVGCWRKKRKGQVWKCIWKRRITFVLVIGKQKDKDKDKEKRLGKENVPGKDWVPWLDYSGGCQLLDEHELAPAMMWGLWSLRLTFSSSCLTLFREVCHHLEKARQL